MSCVSSISIEAGLPNIAGSIKIDRIGTNSNADGAFSRQVRATSGFGTYTPGYDLTFAFDASRSFSIYGGSSTVTPISLSACLILKY